TTPISSMVSPTPITIYLPRTHSTPRFILTLKTILKQWRFRVSIPVPIACEAIALPF
ncbi:hypothetical protein K7432_016663, partial [Basidiobolus ranarum]